MAEVTTQEIPITTDENSVTIDENPVTTHEKPPTIDEKPPRIDENPIPADVVALEPTPKRKPGRPPGSKNKEPGKPRKGRCLIREVEDERKQGQ